VVEGTKLVGEALSSGATIDVVFLDGGTASQSDWNLAAACGDAGARVLELRPGVLARAGDTITPQPIAALVHTLDVRLDDVAARQPTLAVVCAQVGDPGNLGTILRSAGAAGADAVICCAGSVDVYSPKTVRSSAGMLFHVPVVAGPDSEEVLDRVGHWGLRRWGAAATGGRDYTEANLAAPVALVVGNESHGLAPAFAARLDGILTIPMTGRAESLNVAAATSVLCFEAARQRRTAVPR
jgi:RNA methyltransferase, TrmH family